MGGEGVYVWSAYAVAGGVTLALSVWTIIEHVRCARRLRALERQRNGSV